MTQDEIIEMARQAGLVEWHESIQQDSFTFAMPERLEAFAKLVAQHERERIFGELLKMHEKESSRHNYFLHAVVTIRAKGDKK